MQIKELGTSLFSCECVMWLVSLVVLVLSQAVFVCWMVAIFFLLFGCCPAGIEKNGMVETSFRPMLLTSTVWKWFDETWIAFHRFSLAHPHSPVSLGMETNHKSFGGKTRLCSCCVEIAVSFFCKLDQAAFQSVPRYHWLYQKGNKKQVNQTDSMQAEQGKEMGFRFAETISPDTDWSDISLRECSALLVAVVWCFSDLHFYSVVALQMCRNLYAYSSLVSSEWCCYV